MNKEIFVYHSSDGHSRISASIYTPAEGLVPRAVIQLSHGMCEYVDRYEHMARWFCERGFVFCGNDHLGHKNTALLNHDKLGYFGERGARRFLVEDLELLHREMAQRYPELPYFLYGHSMGSFLARLYARRFGRCLSGLIISGTSGKKHAAALGKTMARVIVSAKGPRYISQKLYEMSNGSFAKAFSADGSSGWLSRDREICASYAADPACSFRFTASAYYELFDMVEACNTPDWYSGFPKELPVLLVSGDKDPVGGFGDGPREVYTGLVRAGIRDVRLDLYPDGRHEMHNEINREEVFQAELSWIENILYAAVPEEDIDV